MKKSNSFPEGFWQEVKYLKRETSWRQRETLQVWRVHLFFSWLQEGTQVLAKADGLAAHCVSCLQQPLLNVRTGNRDTWRTLKPTICRKWFHDILQTPGLGSVIISAGSGKLYPSRRRCPWCNSYRRRKWTRWHEFKSWTRLIAFHIALIPLGKVWIQLFSLQLWVNSRADWVVQPWWGI